MSRLLEYNNIRKYTLAGLLLLATGITSYTQKKDTDNDISSQNKNLIEQISVKQTDTAKIYVKKNAGHKYYMSKSDVEKNLDELSRNAYLEDAWIFHNNILTDIGFDEDTLSVKIIEFFLSTTIINAKPNDTITLYHIHPDSYIKNRFSYPSIADIINHGTLKPKMYNNIKLVQKMFDGRGMWEYDVTDKMLEEINKYDNNNTEEDYLLLYITINNIYNNLSENNQNKLIKSVASNNTDYSKPSITKYINNMSEKGIILKFTPSNKLKK